MHTFKIVATIVLAILLQALLSNLDFFRGYADLPLIVTVYYGLQRSPMLAMFCGLALGLGGDSISGGVLGVGGFAKTLIGYMVASVSVRFSLENPLARLATVAIASAANTLLFVALYQMLDQPLSHADSWQELGRTTGWKVVADTVAAVPIFIVLDRVFSEQTAARRMAIKKRFYE
ncbi:MAG TPA: rod shape-determining protein MreD [Blastocatellia bacterium]|nr:rod shape-determining protein MreD [Blastocatellia bacterium]